jgi:hypothetical protein
VIDSCTVHHVGEQLVAGLDAENHHVEVITGLLRPDERRTRIDGLASVAERKAPVLVATDCLSEGINLQAIACRHPQARNTNPRPAALAVLGNGMVAASTMQFCNSGGR